MDGKRYYVKGSPSEELRNIQDSSTPFIPAQEDTGESVLHKVHERYTKKDLEQLPMTFIVVFSGGTKRERDYLSPIVTNKRSFPMLKLEFLADDTFLQDGKPAIFDFALQRQKLYGSSTTTEHPDHYFLMTDVDDFGCWVTKELPVCEAQNIKVLVSNPCFEVWLYYATRQDKFEGFVKPDNAKELSQVVKTWCGQQIKGGLQTKKYLFRLRENIANARMNYTYDVNLRYGDLFSTNVFELGETILPIVEEELKNIFQQRAGRRKASSKG